MIAITHILEQIQKNTVIVERIIVHFIVHFQYPTFSVSLLKINIDPCSNQKPQTTRLPESHIINHSYFYPPHQLFRHFPAGLSEIFPAIADRGGLLGRSACEDHACRVDHLQ